VYYLVSYCQLIRLDALHSLATVWIGWEKWKKTWAGSPNLALSLVRVMTSFCCFALSFYVSTRVPLYIFIYSTPYILQSLHHVDDLFLH
jgi:hypothetical protein